MSSAIARRAAAGACSGGTEVRGRMVAGSTIQLASQSGFRYSATLTGEFSSGPTVPPSPFTECQAMQ